MTNRMTRAQIGGAAACVLTAALLVPQLPVTGHNPGVARGADDWVPLTILYSSDIKGKIDPCG